PATVVPDVIEYVQPDARLITPPAAFALATAATSPAPPPPDPEQGTFAMPTLRLSRSVIDLSSLHAAVGAASSRDEADATAPAPAAAGYCGAGEVMPGTAAGSGSGSGDRSSAKRSATLESTASVTTFSAPSVVSRRFAVSTTSPAISSTTAELFGASDFPSSSSWSFLKPESRSF